MRLKYIAVFLFLNFATNAHAQFFSKPQFKILHHYLRLKIFPEEGRLEAHDTLTIKSLADNVTKLEPLYLQEMKVKEVKVNGEKVKRKYLSPYLTISLTKPLSKDEQALIDVVYEKEPYFYEEKVFGTKFTYGQILPNSSYSTHVQYYPDTDHSSTADILITVPKGYVAVSAGALQEIKEEGEFTTYHWKCNSSAHIVPFAWAVAKYKKFEAVSKYGDKIEVYALPGDEQFGEEKLDFSIEIVNWLNERYGKNPFEKIGVIEVEPKSDFIACSTKTLAFFRKKTFSVPIKRNLQTLKILRGFYETLIYVDEISHQWVGYKVEMENFQAEMMAQYTDTLFAEHLTGKEIVKYHMKIYKDAYVMNANMSKYDVSILQAAVLSSDHDAGIYFNKGAYALHMLRMLVGDKLFFKALKDYFTTYEGQRVKFDAFEKTFKKVVPYDISWFFEQWFHRPGYPQYVVSSKSAKQKNGKYKVDVTISQKQKDLFKMPLDITVKMKGKSKTFERVWVQEISVTKSFVVDKKPVSVTIDEEEKVLKTVEYR